MTEASSTAPQGAEWLLENSASSTRPPYGQGYTSPSSALYATADSFAEKMHPVCARRLSKLETFLGDVGYPKPATKAVLAVRDALTAIYKHNPNLDSPTITPSVDGEVLVTWRQPKGTYLTLHFDRGSEFEWNFKQTSPVCGKADSADPDIQRQLAAIVTFFQNPAGMLPYPPWRGGTSTITSLHSMHKVKPFRR